MYVATYPQKETDPILRAKKANMSITENTEPCWEKRRRYAKQVFMVSLASLGYLFTGMTLTWPNVLHSHLATDNTTLFGTELHLEEWQFDMLASLISIASVFGLLLSNWLVQRIGRQKSLMASMMPGLLAWVTLGLAVNTPMLLFGRFCDGVTHGMVALTGMAYATEIPDTAIRGAVCTTCGLAFLFGTAICVGLGLAMTWYAVALCIVAPILVYICLIVPFLPESPTFLIVTGKEKEAIKVLRRLRGNYINIETEMALVKKMNDDVARHKGWRFVLQREVQKHILVLTILFLLQGFTGTEVLRANTVRILKVSGVTSNTDLLAAILLLVPIAGAFVLSWVVDSLGRRGSLVVSLAFMMVTYAVLGADVHLQTYSQVSVVPREFNDTALPPPYEVEFSDDTGRWITFVSLIVCLFAMNLGMESLPWQLCSEYFPTTIRSQAMSLSMIIGYSIAAIPLQLYTVMDNLLTTAGLFWFYGAVSGIGVVFTVLCVPETARKMVG